MKNLPRVDLQSVFIYLIPFLLFSFLVDRSQCAPAVEGDEVDGGCYYMFNHYGEGDRILTNEPCLNCTCHNSMLMCYLRVCPFTKPIGQDCTIEKKPDQCCPVINCPTEQVPVSLVTPSALTSTTAATTSLASVTESTELANYERGCEIEGKYYPDGAQVAGDPTKPCELCYCIRNRTACVMQECILHVEGCQPVFQPGVCCPVRYQCDYPPQITDQSTVAGLITTTISSIFSSTPQPGGCLLEGEYYADGSQIPGAGPKPSPCEHCYCMRGDIVCAVQECGAPLENEGGNCTAIAPPPGLCCPDKYTCESNKQASNGEAATTMLSVDTDEAKVPINETQDHTVVPSLSSDDTDDETGINDEKELGASRNSTNVGSDASHTTISTLQIIEMGPDGIIVKVDGSAKNKSMTDKPVTSSDLDDENTFSTTQQSALESSPSSKTTESDDLIQVQGITLPQDTLTTEKTENVSEVSTEKPVDESKPPSSVDEVGEHDSDEFPAMNDSELTSESDKIDSTTSSMISGDSSVTNIPVEASKDSSEKPLSTDKLLESSTENLLVISEGTRSTEKPLSDEKSSTKEGITTTQPQVSTENTISHSDRPIVESTENYIAPSEIQNKESSENSVASSEKPFEGSTENIIDFSDKPFEGSTENIIVHSETPFEGSTENIIVHSETPFEGSTENSIIPSEKPVLNGESLTEEITAHPQAMSTENSIASSEKPSEGSTESIIAPSEKPLEWSTDNLTTSQRPIEGSTENAIVSSDKPDEESTNANAMSDETFENSNETLISVNGMPTEVSTVNSNESSTLNPLKFSTVQPDESSTGLPSESLNGQQLEFSTVKPVESSTGQPAKSSTSTGQPSESSTTQPIESSNMQLDETSTDKMTSERPVTESPMEHSINADDDAITHLESTTKGTSNVDQDTSVSEVTMKTISEVQDVTVPEKDEDNKVTPTSTLDSKPFKESNNIPNDASEKDFMQTTVIPSSEKGEDQAIVQDQSAMEDSTDKKQIFDLTATTPQPTNLDMNEKVNGDKIQQVDEASTVKNPSITSENAQMTTPTNFIQEDKVESSSVTIGMELESIKDEPELQTTGKPDQPEIPSGNFEGEVGDLLKEKVAETGGQDHEFNSSTSPSVSNMNENENKQPSSTSAKPHGPDGVIIGEMTVSSTPEPAESLSMHRSSTSSPNMIQHSSTEVIKLPADSETENEIGDDTEKIAHDQPNLASTQVDTHTETNLQQESSTLSGVVPSKSGQDDTTNVSQPIPDENEPAIDKTTETFPKPLNQQDEFVTTEIPLQIPSKNETMHTDKPSVELSTEKAVSMETESDSEKTTQAPIKFQHDKTGEEIESGTMGTVGAQDDVNAEQTTKASSEILNMHETHVIKDAHTQKPLSNDDEEITTLSALIGEVSTSNPIKSTNMEQGHENLSAKPVLMGVSNQSVVLVMESTSRPVTVTDQKDEENEKTTQNSMQNDNNDIAPSELNDGPSKSEEQSSTVASIPVNIDGGEATVSSLQPGDDTMQTINGSTLVSEDGSTPEVTDETPIKHDGFDTPYTTTTRPVTGESDSSEQVTDASKKPLDKDAQSLQISPTLPVVGEVADTQTDKPVDQATGDQNIDTQTAKNTQMLLSEYGQVTDTPVRPINTVTQSVKVSPLLGDGDYAVVTTTESTLSEDREPEINPEDQDTKSTGSTVVLPDNKTLAEQVTTVKTFTMDKDKSITVIPAKENLGLPGTDTENQTTKPDTSEATTFKFMDDQDKFEIMKAPDTRPEVNASEKSPFSTTDEKLMVSTTGVPIGGTGATEVDPHVLGMLDGGNRVGGEASLNDEPINLQGTTVMPPAQTTTGELNDSELNVTKIVSEVSESQTTFRPSYDESSQNDQVSSSDSTAHPIEESATKATDIASEGAQVTETSLDDSKSPDENITNATYGMETTSIPQISSTMNPGNESSRYPGVDSEEGEMNVSHEITTQPSVDRPESSTVLDISSEKFQDGSSTDMPFVDEDENPSPMGVPGEGYCYVEGKTYQNGSNIPPTTPCHIVCACQNSIVHCLLVHCPPPPKNTGDCKPIYKSGVCCPDYDCDDAVGSTVTVTPGPGNEFTKDDHNLVTITPETPSLETTEISRETLASESPSNTGLKITTSHSILSDTSETSGSSSQEKDTTENSETGSEIPLHDPSSESSSDSVDLSHSSPIPTTTASSLVNQQLLNQTTDRNDTYSVANVTGDGSDFASSENPILSSTSSQLPNENDDILDASKVEALMNETMNDNSSPMPPGSYYPVTTTTTVTPSSAAWPYPTPTPASVMSTGACLFDGRVYMSAQQIPRDDPCDFCFCFRGDIICLQQSCPPPIPGCYEEPIPGFCCPRYECPVGNGNNVTTQPPLFPPSYYHNQILNGVASGQNPGAMAANMPTGPGCEIQGEYYESGQLITSTSGPCLECRCGATGMMECDPRECQPEPMLRKMIAAITSR